VHLGLSLDDGVDKLIQENVGRRGKQMEYVRQPNKFDDTLVVRYKEF
jgi:hypothetical protein